MSNGKQPTAGCPTTLEFPERDWNWLFSFLPNTPHTDRQHLNSLKGIETFPFCTGICRMQWQITDNTWIPWKGLKQDLTGRKRVRMYLTDNTWIPWKGLKLCLQGSLGLNSTSDNTWIPWKGLKLYYSYNLWWNAIRPTTLEFPERDWNKPWNRITFAGFSACRQHLNSLKGIETKFSTVWLRISKIRQHLNSLKGIETSLGAIRRHSFGVPDNTWIPWKGLKPFWFFPFQFLLLPTTLEFPERDWNFLSSSTCLRYSARQHLNSLKGIETPVSALACRQLSQTDNTWIPWKGLKQGRGQSNLWKEQTDNTWIPWKGLKRGIWQFKAGQTGPDNTWIPWKGLKLRYILATNADNNIPTTLEFPERDWNSMQLYYESACCSFTDNTWIPWKGLKLYAK